MPGGDEKEKSSHCTAVGPPLVCMQIRNQHASQVQGVAWRAQHGMVPGPTAPTGQLCPRTNAHTYVAAPRGGSGSSEGMHGGVFSPPSPQFFDKDNVIFLISCKMQLQDKLPTCPIPIRILFLRVSYREILGPPWSCGNGHFPPISPLLPVRPAGRVLLIVSKLLSSLYNFHILITPQLLTFVLVSVFTGYNSVSKTLCNRKRRESIYFFWCLGRDSLPAFTWPDLTAALNPFDRQVLRKQLSHWLPGLLLLSLLHWRLLIFLISKWALTCKNHPLLCSAYTLPLAFAHALSQTTLKFVPPPASALHSRLTFNSASPADRFRAPQSWRAPKQTLHFLPRLCAAPTGFLTWAKGNSFFRFSCQNPGVMLGSSLFLSLPPQQVLLVPGLKQVQKLDPFTPPPQLSRRYTAVSPLGLDSRRNPLIHFPDPALPATLSPPPSPRQSSSVQPDQSQVGLREMAAWDGVHSVPPPRVNLRSLKGSVRLYVVSPCCTSGCRSSLTALNAPPLNMPDLIPPQVAVLAGLSVGNALPSHVLTLVPSGPLVSAPKSSWKMGLPWNTPLDSTALLSPDSLALQEVIRKKLFFFPQLHSTGVHRVHGFGCLCYTHTLIFVHVHVWAFDPSRPPQECKLCDGKHFVLFTVISSVSRKVPSTPRSAFAKCLWNELDNWYTDWKLHALYKIKYIKIWLKFSCIAQAELGTWKGI